MPRAIVKQGVLLPVEPLPTDWADGTEVTVEKLAKEPSFSEAIHSVDQWMDEVEALAQLQTDDDNERLAQAVAHLRQHAKILAQQGKR